MPFHVHVDPDLLARQDLAAAVSLPGVTGPDGAPVSSTEDHRGASDTRLAARLRSERARARDAQGAGRARAYAFRRH